MVVTLILFGPRHFLTDNREVYDFLDKYCPLRKLHHKLFTYVEQDDDFYSFPINKDDVERMPDKNNIQKEPDALPLKAKSKS